MLQTLLDVVTKKSSKPSRKQKGPTTFRQPGRPERLRIGAPLNKDDPTTYYGGGEKGYIDYPSLAQDRGEHPKASVDRRCR